MTKDIGRDTGKDTGKDTGPLFNLQTMSGVFAGTRTPIFQRIRAQARNGATTVRHWLQLAWYVDPAVCVVYAFQPGTAVAYEQPMISLADPLTGDFTQKLQAALHATEQQLVSCGSCRFWQSNHIVTLDQLPIGVCRWRPDGSDQDAALPDTLAMQSTLALDCAHWQQVLSVADDPTSAVRSMDRASLTPMRKAAESADIRLSLWQRMRKRFMAKQAAGQPMDLHTMLLERSGVGAGTEPCFVCQGRLANLGALAVETAEGDKQTFSIWRCRHCYTLYLNNWIDRWERLDNLETEETYYRLAPAEAKQLLTLLYSVVGGEHPNRRAERDTERTQFLHFMVGRTPLSHQIRQGR